MIERIKEILDNAPENLDSRELYFDWYTDASDTENLMKTILTQHEELERLRAELAEYKIRYDTIY